jgi:hypothetical protein
MICQQIKNTLNVHVCRPFPQLIWVQQTFSKERQNILRYQSICLNSETSFPSSNARTGLLLRNTGLMPVHSESLFLSLPICPDLLITFPV